MLQLTYKKNKPQAGGEGERKMSNKKTMNNRNAKKAHRESYKTFDGHALTTTESKFIDEYVATGNGRQSVISAGYKTNTPAQYAQSLLNKKYITEEINHRLEEMKSKRTADAVEILEYLTSVMRGELKDQFGLEAPLSERTKAATELAKRQIDIPNRLGGKKDAEVKITLDWKRD
jgi:phage terminase small subunit